MKMLEPSTHLLSKIATILQVVDEARLDSSDSIAALKPLLADREVAGWLDDMHKAGLIDTRQVNRIAHGLPAQKGGA